MKFDIFLATVGDWGRFQKVKYTLICLTYMLPPIMVYTYTFTAATPKFRCIDPAAINTDGYNPELNKLFESNYKPTKEQCDKTQRHLSLSECQRCYIQTRNGNQSSLANRTLEKCDQYVYSREYYTKTLVEEVR
jgi:OCT family organic cation transporter-like MFS transporter 4/5